VHEWDTTVHKFTYSAKCETQVEVVYLKRRVVKEIMDIYSPWLEDRFEVFRKGVVRSLAATEASGRRGSTTAEEPGSSEGEDECADSTDDPPPATAGKEATQNAVVGAANRLRCFVGGSARQKFSEVQGAPQAAVDWNFMWNQQAWNMYPGERLVDCTARGSSTSGTVQLRHASAVNAEWDGTGIYDEDAVQVEFVNGTRLSGFLRRGGAATTIQWSNGMVWTLVQVLPAAMQPAPSRPLDDPLRHPLLA